VPPAADSPATAAVPARRRILDTAYRLFAAEGIQAAGVDRIVAEAQVVKATFYRHFPAKGDLVCAELSQRQLAALRRLPADAELPPLPADTRPAPDIAHHDQLLTSASATEARES
jgi:AcrR family transcriptional regulator